MTELVKNIPHKLGMAIVYIQHLDPNHKSMLSEILGRLTKLKVQNAKHLLHIKPDNIYVIPPGKNLSIVDGVLTLKKRQQKPFINMPVDAFFKPLAELYKEFAIGVVLSGNGQDGTMGLKAIKDAGGLTFAQDKSAKFSSMPNTAINNGVADAVLSPKEIARQLELIGKSTDVISPEINDAEQDNTNISNEELFSITDLLQKAMHMDFHHYKSNTIKRRIVRRMLLNKCQRLEQYHAFLKKHPVEIEALFHDLLINVTSFFRDPDSLEYLRKKILPSIISKKASDEIIRIWVPGCATGEEAYSLAIILTELLTEKGISMPFQIFATDLSERAINKARAGVFQKSDLENVSPKRLQRFFIKIDGSYRVAKPIRDACIFAPHNVFSNPPFLKLDLVSCCNLMIYLKPVLQKKILSIFHYALRPSGYLVLGKSEAVGEAGSLFSQIEKKYKVFIRKNEVSSKVKFEVNTQLPELKQKQISLNTDPTRTIKINLEKRVEDILLSRYVMASVVVNKELDILQFHGPVNTFIEITTGKASLNLLKLAKPGLVVDLRNILHKASRSNKTVRKTGVTFKHNDSGMKAAIEVVPLDGDGDKLFLIVFEKIQESVESQGKSSSRDQLVKRLQLELESTKDDMRSMLEEQETNNEELQSANEEIVSSNEELQSINEELETSKEEIESSLEELTTINNELQVRNEQLAESQEYSQAIEETIREAVLVLDKNFRVRSANKSFYRIFRTTEEETEGMLMYELGNRQWDILELRQLLEEVLAKRTLITGFEVEHNFPLIGHKVMLIHARTVIQKTQHNQIIVIAIEDITHHKLVQRAAQEREMWFRNMADNAPAIIWMCDHNLGRSFFNKTWYEFIGEKPEHHRNIGKSWEKYIHPEDKERYHKQFQKAFNQFQMLSIEFRLKRADGQYRWMLDVAKPNYTQQGQFAGYIGTTTELHDRKMMMLELDRQVKERTQELKTINNELHRSNSELQQFAYVASHDLQEPLRKILTYIDRIKNNKETLSEAGTGYLQKIFESSRRMTTLIDDLLTFSSISFANRKFIKVDMNSILQNVITDLELLIAEKNGKVTVDKKLMVIEGEPVQLTQLFSNLIGNSLKFAKDDVPIKIEITQKLLSQDCVNDYPFIDGKGSCIELIFSDNGIGFAPEYAEQIFVIFQRLNEKKKYPGTGIGLALCKRIVANHNGFIFAESLKDGSSFHVILPVNQQ